MAVREVADFDHFSPQFAADPAKAFRELRERCPVAWSEHHGGFWVPTRLADIATVARDDAVFSSDRLDDPDTSPIVIPRIPAPVRSTPIDMDPPEFYVYRRMLNPILSPDSVDRVAIPILQQVTDYCIDLVIERGSCDLVTEIVSPVPALFTLIWLGLPTEEWERFAHLNHAIVCNRPDSPEFAEAVADFPWQFGLIQETVDARRADPRDDVITHLVDQTVDGEPLSDQLILEIVGLLITGGVDTTTSLTSQSLMWLHQHPEHRATLLQGEHELDLATEEFLRYFCPVTTLARTVMDDVELGGQQLERGERVMLPWYSANRDPEVFPDPDTMQLDRFPNRHTTFGLGIHRCVGSHLARASFKTMITTILRRLPDYRIDPSGASFYPAVGINTGWSNLPARFTPGPTVGARLPA